LSHPGIGNAKATPRIVLDPVVTNAFPDQQGSLSGGASVELIEKSNGKARFPMDMMKASRTSGAEGRAPGDRDPPERRRIRGADYF